METWKIVCVSFVGSWILYQALGPVFLGQGCHDQPSSMKYGSCSTVALALVRLLRLMFKFEPLKFCIYTEMQWRIVTFFNYSAVCHGDASPVHRRCWLFRYSNWDRHMPSRSLNIVVLWSCTCQCKVESPISSLSQFRCSA